MFVESNVVCAQLIETVVSYRIGETWVQKCQLRAEY